jgi:alkyl sulfatase BDS1-like metallo-beta-lactamase superfamily hydrolase
VVSVMPRITEAQQRERGQVGAVIAGSRATPKVVAHGFMEAAVSENVYAGVAMVPQCLHVRRQPSQEPYRPGRRRVGRHQLVRHRQPGPPSVEITHPGQEEVIDGVRIQFQMTPGTECPVEMNFFFPDYHALCMAENATHNLHNLLTLRGAVVRDPRIWSRYLNGVIDLFTADSQVAFASHFGPRGARNRSSPTWASSATCTPTCTIRLCACSTTATPGSRSPR